MKRRILTRDREFYRNLIALAIPMHFVNEALGTNFMFISTPSPGSPLMPLYGLFGNGYVAAALVLMVLVWIVLFLPWEIARRRKEKQQAL